MIVEEVVMKIWIGEEYDGFEVRVYDDEMTNSQYSVRINQEDSVDALVHLFEFLGYQTEFEEVY